MPITQPKTLIKALNTVKANIKNIIAKNQVIILSNIYLYGTPNRNNCKTLINI